MTDLLRHVRPVVHAPHPHRHRGYSMEFIYDFSIPVIGYVTGLWGHLVCLQQQDLLRKFPGMLGLKVKVVEMY